MCLQCVGARWLFTRVARFNPPEGICCAYRLRIGGWYEHGRNVSIPLRGFVVPTAKWIWWSRTTRARFNPPEGICCAYRVGENGYRNRPQFVSIPLRGFVVPTGKSDCGSQNLHCTVSIPLRGFVVPTASNTLRFWASSTSFNPPEGICCAYSYGSEIEEVEKFCFNPPDGICCAYSPVRVIDRYVEQVSIPLRGFVVPTDKALSLQSSSSQPVSIPLRGFVVPTGSGRRG